LRLWNLVIVGGTCLQAATDRVSQVLEKDKNFVAVEVCNFRLEYPKLFSTPEFSTTLRKILNASSAAETQMEPIVVSGLNAQRL
jgi:hypothetical protein